MNGSKDWGDDYGNTAMEIVLRDILEVKEIVGLGDKLGMVSKEMKESRMVHGRWIMVPFTEIQDKGGGACLLGKVTNLVLDRLVRSASQLEMY